MTAVYRGHVVKPLNDARKRVRVCVWGIHNHKVTVEDAFPIAEVTHPQDGFWNFVKDDGVFVVFEQGDVQSPLVIGRYERSKVPVDTSTLYDFQYTGFYDLEAG